MYDVESFIQKEEEKERRKVCYCRVSSRKQRDDLERQVEFLREKIPGCEIITDIGSGLNFKRKGLTSLLESVCRGDVQEIVVAHKDRLCRFGFDLIKWLVEFHNGRVLVLDNTTLSPNEELVDDMLAIVHVFSCRINGFRKYKSKIKEDSDLSESGAENKDQAVDGNCEMGV